MPTVATFVTPNGTVAPVLSDGNFNAPFNVTATFTPDGPGGSCAALSYRQYVSGTFSVNGLVVPFYLCQASGVQLSATTAQEDGCPPNGNNCTGATAYGYRQCVMIADGYTNPDQPTGADYWMFDAPGFTNVQAGTTYAMNLTFRGEIQNNGATMTQSTWQVAGTVTTAASNSAPAPDLATSCAHDETPIGLRVDDTPEGKRMAILSLARAPGSPPLNPSAVGLRLWDKAGHEIHAEPATAHEVGDRRRTTAHLFYPLPAKAAPVKGSVALNGEHWGEMPAQFD